MARVKQAEIEKARGVIRDMMTSPAFPSGDALLESNMVLFNTMTNIKGRIKEDIPPDKTLCCLLVKALDIGNGVTGEALWKRYRRATINRDTSGGNRAIESDDVTYENINDNIYRDTSEENRATPYTLFIPLEISQTDLAEGLAGFFESKGYPPASLLKTCLMAMEEMPVKMDVSEIHEVIDTRYDHED